MPLLKSLLLAVVASSKSSSEIFHPGGGTKDPVRTLEEIHLGRREHLVFRNGMILYPLVDE